MISKFSRILFTAALGTTLIGCSSSGSDQAKIEAIASQRATILSSSLPIEHGPLHIMQAKASGTVVEIMMIYNETKGIAPQTLMKQSTHYYCNNEDVKTTLEHGVSYQITIRNPRGKMLSEQVISMDTCNDVGE